MRLCIRCKRTRENDEEDNDDGLKEDLVRKNHERRAMKHRQKI